MEWIRGYGEEGGVRALGVHPGDRLRDNLSHAVRARMVKEAAVRENALEK